MMAAEGFLDVATGVALGLLILALFVIIARLALGPTVADRVLGLDMLVTVGIGLIAVIAVRTGQFAYVDVAIALGLVGFLATTAFARFLIHHARRGPGGLIAAGPVEAPGEDANVDGGAR